MKDMIKFLKLNVLVIMVLFCGNVFSQNINETYFQDNSAEINQQVVKSDSLGNVVVFQDERLKELMQTDSTINSKNPWFNGYRVQIFLGGSTQKERAFEVKKEFEELFPEERAYVVFTAPDFRVRVGNFRTKIEAISLFKECEKHFPNCYPVKTKIQFSELIPLEKEEGDELIVDDNNE
jgi:hypothetical protein